MCLLLLFLFSDQGPDPKRLEYRRLRILVMRDRISLAFNLTLCLFLAASIVAFNLTLCLFLVVSTVDFLATARRLRNRFFFLKTRLRKILE